MVCVLWYAVSQKNWLLLGALNANWGTARSIHSTGIEYTHSHFVIDICLYLSISICMYLCIGSLGLNAFGLPGNWFWRLGSITYRFYCLEASPKCSSLERFPMLSKNKNVCMYVSPFSILGIICLSEHFCWRVFWVFPTRPLWFLVVLRYHETCRSSIISTEIDGILFPLSGSKTLQESFGA